MINCDGERNHDIIIVRKRWRKERGQSSLKHPFSSLLVIKESKRRDKKRKGRWSRHGEAEQEKIRRDENQDKEEWKEDQEEEMSTENDKLF